MLGRGVPHSPASPPCTDREPPSPLKHNAQSPHWDNSLYFTTHTPYLRTVTSILDWQEDGPCVSGLAKWPSSGSSAYTSPESSLYPPAVWGSSHTNKKCYSSNFTPVSGRCTYWTHSTQLPLVAPEKPPHSSHPTDSSWQCTTTLLLPLSLMDQQPGSNTMQLLWHLNAAPIYLKEPRDHRASFVPDPAITVWKKHK